MADKDNKKKISLGGIDDAAEGKGSFFKTLWQLVKFLVVSGLVTIIQLVLANVLPFIFDSVTATLPTFLQGIFSPNVIFDASTAEGLEQFGKYVVGGTVENGVIIGGIVTWGYLLPFFLSNLIANIYGFYQNKKTTFKSDAPWYNFAIYIVLMIALILFSTWFQGWLVGIIAKINWAWIQPLARTIASLAAGFIQMVVLFPMEKFVLLREKKKDDGEEAPAEVAE
jgi:putative flippase GtrA